MALSALSSDPLERVLAMVHEEYRSRLGAKDLARAIEVARSQAFHMGIENKPALVQQAVRDYLDSVWSRRAKTTVKA